MATRCYLVAGELSGDTHGAELMASLRELCGEGLSFAGLGGNQMRTVGGERMDDWIEDAAVVGLWEVLKNYGYFKKRFAACLQEIDSWSPNVVVLIDYPGFNLRLARALRDQGFEGKIVYYISPQVWAWNRKRIPKMAAMLDLMICIFPFEKPLYEASGLPTVFAGHPLVDELSDVPPREREKKLLGLFPGSRQREVRKLFPMMVEAAQEFVEKRPDWRVATAAANPRLAERMKAMASEAGLNVEVSVGDAHALMQRAQLGAVASGTATLEAAWFGLPYCLVYRVAWPTYVIGKRLVHIPYLGIVNVLAEREVVRELIQGEATPEALQREWERLLVPEHAEALQRDLASVVAQLGGAGTHGRAAEAIANVLPV